LVAPLGLPIYEGYDGLDELQLTFLTLPSRETVTLASYLNSPQPGTSIHVDSTMPNIPQIIFESCQQLQVSREEVLWFNPDWQEEIEGLYVANGSIWQSQRYANEKRQESPQLEELPSSIQYEPIDCFFHALRIYTRADYPEYWAMLQHNLGLAYFNRTEGSSRENLETSIECYRKSLEIYNRDNFPEKWEINQQDSRQSQLLLESLNQKSRRLRKFLHKRNLSKDIIERRIPNRELKGVNLSGAHLSGTELLGANLNGANLDGCNLSISRLSIARLRGASLRGANLSSADLFGADLSGADLSIANLRDVNLIGANLSGADFDGANLSGANLSRTKLHGAKFSGVDVRNTRFESSLGISEFMKQNLIDKGAIFNDSSGERSESINLVSR
jgi:uncharacterized protein YjbI with pentapeptide repeats